MSQWRTGSYSYNELVVLTARLKYLKYFPSQGTMFDDTDSLRVGVNSKVDSGKREFFEEEIQDLAKSFGFGVDFYGTLKFSKLIQI
jgi:3-deoxy-D-manno-octulosonic acid (KDO) 8-phosphate synthase